MGTALVGRQTGVTDGVAGVAARDAAAGVATGVKGGHGRWLYISLIRGTGAPALALWAAVVHEPAPALKARWGSDRR